MRTLLRRWMVRHRGVVQAALLFVLGGAIVGALSIRRVVLARDAARQAQASAERALVVARDRQDELGFNPGAHRAGQRSDRDAGVAQAAATGHATARQRSRAGDQRLRAWLCETCLARTGLRDVGGLFPRRALRGRGLPRIDLDRRRAHRSRGGEGDDRRSRSDPLRAGRIGATARRAARARAARRPLAPRTRWPGDADAAGAHRLGAGDGLVG